MSRTCDICEKTSQKGKKITKVWGVKYRTIKHRQPNLRKVTVLVNNEPQQLTICTTCLKSIKSGKYPAYKPLYQKSNTN